LELHVEVGIAGGAGHGLAQSLEFGLSALDAGGLGIVGRAACLQRRARFFSCGSWGPSSAAIWSKARPSRGKAAMLIRVPARRNCQAGSSSCRGNRAAATRDANSTNSTSATTPRPGAERSTGAPEREESELRGIAERRGRTQSSNRRSRRPQKSPADGRAGQGIMAAIRPGAGCSKERRCACGGGGSSRRQRQHRAGAGGRGQLLLVE
jgi:hypothetical protein